MKTTSDMRAGGNGRRCLRAAAVGSLVLAGLAIGGPASALTHGVSDPCDVQVVPVGAGVPGDPKVIEAAPGDVVSLLGDAACVPTIVGGVLGSGDGITIAAPGVTFDLNGHSLRSATDIAGEAAAQGLDVENAGVSVAAANVTVTNSSLVSPSTVGNFTANFDLGKGSDGSSLRGNVLGAASPEPGTLNLRGGDAHGGGVLAIDRTQGLTIDHVQLVDVAADLTALAGDNAVDWKRCSGPAGTLSNSVLQGPLTGVRVRGCTNGGLKLLGNHITSPGGPGVDLPRDVKGSGNAITGNTIENNGADGVIVGATDENIAITGNTIQHNAGAGILLAAAARNITGVNNNTFLDNALGNVVIE